MGYSLGVKARLDRLRKPETAPRKAAAPPVPAHAVDAVLLMQRGHGNAFVARMLQASRPALHRAPTAAPAETPIRADAGVAIVVSDTASFYEKPDESSKVLSQLAKDQTVKLRSEAGTFYGIDVDGKRGYARSGDLFTAVDELPSAKQAEFEAKAAAASKTIDDAGHTIGGKPPTVAGTAKVGSGIGFPKWFMDLQYKVSMMDQWGPEEEAAQQVLDDYATWYVQTWHGGKVPPSLKSLFEYIGRSSKNDAAARKGGMQGTKHFGGAKGQPNWCTATTTTGVIDGLEAMGYVPRVGAQAWANNVAAQKAANGQKNFIGAPTAYSAPLLPGDQVMYLFAGAQYGGHTVTVVDDLGDSFTHISGNTGAAVGVGIGEASRWKAPPMPGFSLEKCNKVKTEEEREASTAYIATVPFGNKVLTYSIVRYGAMFDELETLKALDPATDAAAVKKMLDKYLLKPATVTA
jgi:hypothetical protein